MQITHPLSAYRHVARLSVDDFCRRLDISTAAYASYICGRRFPRPDVLERIETLTDGEVTARDFILFRKAAVSPGPRNTSGGTTGEAMTGEPMASPAPPCVAGPMMDLEDLIIREEQMDLEDLINRGGQA